MTERLALRNTTFQFFSKFAHPLLLSLSLSLSLEWRNGDEKEIVAIKILKETATREVETDFMQEVETMSAFHHENILSLKGIVYHNGTNIPWMVFEYMKYGDLTKVLRANSPQLNSLRPDVQPLSKVAHYDSSYYYY